jgi:hypothetical protein
MSPQQRAREAVRCFEECVADLSVLYSASMTARLQSEGPMHQKVAGALEAKVKPLINQVPAAELITDAQWAKASLLIPLLAKPITEPSAPSQVRSCAVPGRTCQRPALPRSLHQRRNLHVSRKLVCPWGSAPSVSPVKQKAAVSV